MAMKIVYSPSLILLSVLVAILASYVALNLAYSVTQAHGYVRKIWLGFGSVAMGVGIWSMHFVGMLAMEMPGMEMAYDIPLMVLSVLVAVLGSAIALFVVSRHAVRRSSLVVAGIAMAAAIAGMHYLGMFSMRMAARIEWNLPLVALSVLIALGASFGALTISIRLRDKPDRLWLLALASVLMGVAISGMHYTGMLAATFVHDPSIEIDRSHLLVSSGLSLATISTSLLILGFALFSSVGLRLSREWLGTSEEKFRVLVAAVKEYAIILLDPNGNITTWNSGAERIIGYPEREILGKHVSTFYTKDDRDSDIARNELSIARELGHFEGEAVRVRRDGVRFWANVVIDPLFNAEGKITGYSNVVRDITQIKAVEEQTRSLNEELENRVRERTLALQERESQLRTITNAIPILVAQFDRNETLLFANNSFCDWFEIGEKRISELKFYDLLGEDRYHANKVYIDRVLAGETVTYERKSTSNHRHLILNITFVPEFDHEGLVKGFIVVAGDVSKYKAIEAELKSAKEEAEVANETKSAFLANMSHEIRTPLGAVIGFSELMLDERLSPSERQSNIEIIKRNGRLLSTIINDILDLSKVEAGKLAVERTEVPIQELIGEISVLLNLEAQSKGIRLAVETEGPVPSVIRTDPTRLRQILFNIVGNAIKFTEKGHVNVKVELAPDDKTQLAFVVEDTGTGIAPDQAARLFSPFTQADVTTTRKFGGTGLGLVLSRKLAQALGGDIQLIESVPGKGSKFQIRIQHGQTKFEEFTSAAKGASPKPEPITSKDSQRLARRSVLVVDDSPDNLALIQRFLTLAGASVETANNGREGMEKALAQDFSAVLMDLQMPEMDGIEATRALRERGYRRPIVALTAHAMKEERRRCLSLGFTEHLTKPIDREALIRVLSEFPV